MSFSAAVVNHSRSGVVSTPVEHQPLDRNAR